MGDQQQVATGSSNRRQRFYPQTPYTHNHYHFNLAFPNLNHFNFAFPNLNHFNFAFPNLNCLNFPNPNLTQFNFANPNSHSNPIRHKILNSTIVTLLCFLQVKSTGKDELSPFREKPVTAMASIISFIVYILVFGANQIFPNFACEQLVKVMNIFGSILVASLVSLLLPKSWQFISYGLCVLLLVADFHQMIRKLYQTYVQSRLHRRQPSHVRGEAPLLLETMDSTDDGAMSLRFLRRRHSHNRDQFAHGISPHSSFISQRPVSNFSLFTIIILSFLILVLGIFLIWVSMPESLSNKPAITKWHDYTLIEAASFIAKNGTVIVCAVSQPYLPFLNNWLISITRQKHQDKVLVIAEDYGTLDKVNERWPGHAVLIPPDEFGSKGFINFAARRLRHLLQILELGYNVMCNDVDLVWLADPFAYLLGNHDIYFADDMAAVKPLNHSHDLPSPGKKGRTNICSCMIFLRPTDGAKLVMRKWIKELHIQPSSKGNKSNYQSAFNWALKRTAREVDLYLLPRAAFPPGRLFFKNKTCVKETKGKHVIIQNDYITSSKKKIMRFRQFGLWLVDDHSLESPLGKL